MSNEEHHSRVYHRKSNGSHIIAEDIIANEILPRLPVHSLLKFKCVSRSWYSLISSPQFVDSHRQRAKKTPKLLLASLVAYSGEEISIYSYDERGSHPRHATFVFGKSLPKPLRRMCLPTHSNGLLLLNHEAGWLTVCNPSTREHKLLPEGTADLRVWPVPDNGFQVRGRNRAGFGFVPSINAYKACQYFYRYCGVESRRWSMGFEVITLGVDSSSWRAVKEEEVPYPVHGSSPMAVGESIYFRIDQELHEAWTPELAFFSFSLADEKFRIIRLPSNLPTGGLAFVELEGGTYLCSLTDEGKKYDLWIKNCEEGKNVLPWTRIFSIDMLRPARAVCPVAIRCGKLLLRVVDSRQKFKLLSYNSGSNSLEKETKIDLIKDLAYYYPKKHKLAWFPDHNSLVQVVSYIKTLVPVN